MTFLTLPHASAYAWGIGHGPTLQPYVVSLSKPVDSVPAGLLSDYLIFIHQ